MGVRPVVFAINYGKRLPVEYPCDILPAVFWEKGEGEKKMKQKIRLPKLFGEGCVLQQNAEVPIWGWCDPGSAVTVTLQEQEQQVTADSSGRFEAVLFGLKPGGPFVLKVQADGQSTVTVREVFVGEVFVCSGQSNMELPMARVRERFPEEFEKGGNPKVHEFKVMEHYDLHQPLSDHVQAQWRTCTGDILPVVSALVYFVGKKLYENMQVPVGILNLSLGGSPIEAWMSEAALKQWPQYQKERIKYASDEYCRNLMRYKEEEEKIWQEEIQAQERQCIHKQWETIQLPCFLEESGISGFCGSIWLRRTFDVPKEYAGSGGLLRFGTMVDSDMIWINGILVGQTGYRFPPRRYPIPEGILREGENEICIRLVCRAGDGRVTPDKPYELLLDGWDQAISLDGTWEYQIRARTEAAPEQIFINRTPTGLFCGMVAPCLHYRVQGVIWYQGESNDQMPDRYQSLLEGMIRDWRVHWGQQRLPFIVVQLPNCSLDIASGDAWPRIREAQRRAVKKMPDTALTVNLDLGEDYDLHPTDKKTVAERIVRAVFSLIYAENMIWEGPKVKAWKKDKGAVTLLFDSGDENVLCTPEDTPLKIFEMAGEDGIFYPCKAEVVKDLVRLISDQVSDPCHVRYAWSKAPGNTLLYNETGLPAVPFLIEV